MERKERGRRAALIAGMTAALFAASAAAMRCWLSRLTGMGDALALSALFSLCYAGMMAVYARAMRPGLRPLAFAGLFAGLAMLTRISFLDYMTADYDLFLSRWVEVFREGGVATLAENVGDYNLLYQYVLLLIARAPLPDLYLIKLFSVAFDCALAAAMCLTAARLCGERTGLPVFCITLALPTVLLCGACWAQCDAVYAFFVVMCLYWLEGDRPALSAAALSLAFAFKLQTIFFFPVVLLALIHRRYKPRHALCFFAVYLATMLPALAAGRGFFDALSVYANQSMGQYYDRLTYNAPNLYLFFPMMMLSISQEYTWLRYVPGVDPKATNEYLDEFLVPQMQNAALIACVLLTLLLVVYWLSHAREIEPEMTLCFALFCAIYLPFVMPKIHDRYFFLADVLSVLYAARRADRRFVPVLVVGASLLSYYAFLTRQRPVDERVAALMMLAALLTVGRDLLTQMRRNRAALREAKGGEAA